MPDEKFLICYNRGCGKHFDPNDNKIDDCQHHPGNPVFHDAYKKWSCCNKKCTDFTNFLNIKGCTKSQHSNIKPPENPKSIVNKTSANEVIEVITKPLNKIPAMERPQFDSPQVKLKPTISPILLEQVKGLLVANKLSKDKETVSIGQSCKHNSCKGTYKDLGSNNEVCLYHPGIPIFHEGMKYWSCCKKKTTDFAEFLEQCGCSQGNHVWIEEDASKKVNCRMDWHQTVTHVIVSIYAKKYMPNASVVKLNPIHLTVDLYFPEEDSCYNLDIELNGIIDVDASSVNMLQTKAEIKLKKKEPGSWNKLEVPQKNIAKESKELYNEENMALQVDAVDLSDI